jgi:hypothetical protein
MCGENAAEGFASSAQKKDCVHNPNEDVRLLPQF